MGWKAASALLLLAAWVPTPATAACFAGPTGLDAWSDGTAIHLTWNPPPGCDATGDYQILRNGVPIADTSGTSYSEPLQLPVAYTIAYAAEGNSSAPSTLVLLGDPHIQHPSIHFADPTGFVSYIVNMAPCPPFHFDPAYLPFLYVRWECFPLDNLRAKTV